MLVAVATTASTGAVALDEQRMAIPNAGPETPKADVQEQSSKSDEGTEIRIPGLGKLGTLPKMDFGLELLYGAADGKPSTADPDPQNNDTTDQQDLMIHGIMKHRF